jgi:transposase
MLGYSIPPGYRRKEPAKRPKLGPWVGVIDAILEEDKSRPAKQRHTAKRIFDRLRAEHGFTGGYTIVKDYVRCAALRHREMFVPLTHAAGTAQADFGEALVIVGGEQRKAHYLAIDLPHSDVCLATIQHAPGAVHTQEFPDIRIYFCGVEWPDARDFFVTG